MCTAWTRQLKKLLITVVIATLFLHGCTDNDNSTAGPGHDDATAEVTIFSARSVITMDPARPFAEAVAVAGEKILAVGSMSEVVTAVDGYSYEIDATFEEKVIIPGLIDQHVHPLLAGLTMSMEIIAIEDWVLPHATVKKAVDREDYLNRLAEAVVALEAPEEPLFTWGFHHNFHGKLTRQDLDNISRSRPIIVWHRSVHEFILNSAAMHAFEITPEFYETFSESAKSQSNFDEGHFWAGIPFCTSLCGP